MVASCFIIYTTHTHTHIAEPQRTNRHWHMEQPPWTRPLNVLQFCFCSFSFSLWPCLRLRRSLSPKPPSIKHESATLMFTCNYAKGTITLLGVSALVYVYVYIIFFLNVSVYCNITTFKKTHTVPHPILFSHLVWRCARRFNGISTPHRCTTRKLSI